MPDRDKNIDLYDEFGTIFSDSPDSQPIAKNEAVQDKGKNSKGKTRFVFALILLLVVMGFSLGFLSYSNNIKNVFVLEDSTPIDNSEGSQVQAQDILDLRDKDTDSDGLSDYDELYVYNTSPYLEDSDSDGYLDKEELDAGHDPNCPAGRVCLSTTKSNKQDEAVGNNILPDFLPGVDGVTGQDLLAGNLSPDQLRSLLAQMGTDMSEINNLSDEDLQKVYEKTLEELAKKDNDFYAQEQKDTSTQLPSPDNITPDQVRELLILGGMSESDLEGVDDETLLELYRQAISEEQ